MTAGNATVETKERRVDCDEAVPPPWGSRSLRNAPGRPVQEQGWITETFLAPAQVNTSKQSGQNTNVVIFLQSTLHTGTSLRVE